MLTITTESDNETRLLGNITAQCIHKGLFIPLTGDLGAGKTVFVKGLARGLGVPRDIPVTSPTFTIINSYNGRLNLHHADLYRLINSDYLTDSLEDIGFFDLFTPDNVVAAEWAGSIPDFPTPVILSLQVDIFFDMNRFDYRKIQFQASGPGKNEVMERLKKEMEKHSFKSVA